LCGAVENNVAGKLFYVEIPPEGHFLFAEVEFSAITGRLAKEETDVQA
jgi:hypothetical protein